jgi:hypothetical protein
MLKDMLWMDPVVEWMEKSGEEGRKECWEISFNLAPMTTLCYSVTHLQALYV